jgi:FdhE protein
MKSAWDIRIHRATELSSTYPFAAEALRFYAQVAMLQQKIYSDIERSPAQFISMSDSIWGELNASALLPGFSEFLKNVQEIAPSALAEAANALSHQRSSLRPHLLEKLWPSPAVTREVEETEDIAVAERGLAWLFLQPFAEYLATRRRVLSDESPRRCPVCGSSPIVGVLRPEGDGAKKSLICMLCAHEWAFRRIYCPACGEQREPQMAFYSAPEIPHVRVDVCETCHTYLKSVDLTKTGLAVPVVDELAALPLDLWARDKGYHKLQMNAVGL